MIRTEDRENLRRHNETQIHKGPDATYYWYCPHCLFHRTWGTETGAVNGVADHLMARHNIRLTLPPRQKENKGEPNHPRTA